MEYVWRYLPKASGKHAVENRKGAYRRALCGLAPMAHLPSHDVWHADQEELNQRSHCGTCFLMLEIEKQRLAAVALTQLGQEDGLI